MAEKLSDIIKALEEQRDRKEPAYGLVKETGLSFGASNVLEKLQQANAADGYRRVYIQEPGDELELSDVLTDHEIVGRGYKPTNDPPKQFRGSSPLARDTVRHHVTSMASYENAWIGEKLI